MEWQNVKVKNGTHAVGGIQVQIYWAGKLGQEAQTSSGYCIELCNLESGIWISPDSSIGIQITST
jgi:hypothetical protein